MAIEISKAHDNGIIELIDDRPEGRWRGSRSPGESLDGLPENLAAEIAAHWSEVDGSGKSRAEKYRDADAPPPVDLAQYARSRRKQIELGGCDWNGTRLQTDDRSKLLILGAALTMLDGTSSPLIIDGVDYGAKNVTDFRRMNAAITDHVRASFVMLSEVMQKIASGEITTIAQVNVAMPIPEGRSKT